MWWGGLSMPESNFTHYENRCSCSLLLPGIAVDRPAIEKPIKKPLQPLRRGLHRPRLPIPP